jgi:hypothetical protein
MSETYTATDVSNDAEKIKRYLQWATLLVIVCIGVTFIDMMIKNGILRAIKEFDETRKAKSDSPSTSASNKPVVNVDGSAGNTENGVPNATVRISRTPPPATSEENKPSSDVIRTDSGSGDS